MKRREFVGLLGGAAAWPLVAHAQQPTKLARIGYLGFGTALAWATRIQAMRTGLRDLGHIEGKNIVIEFRFAETLDQLREYAAELARMNVDVISRPLQRRWRPFATRPRQFRSYSRPTPIRSASGMWPAFHGPAATSPD